MNNRAAHHAVEHAARHAYGRLLGRLAAYTGDLTVAEDALGDALAKALKTWPQNGVPKHPEAWLLTVGKRRLIDRARHAKYAADAAPDMLLLAMERAATDTSTGWPLPDPRLKLLFVCTHPAIAQNNHTPLMLQTVLGLSVKVIASLLLLPVRTLSQQLVRAKRKIKTAGIPFVVPETHELTERLPAVLEAIYGAFVAGENARDEALADEAIFLTRLCAVLLPKEPSAQGLLALCYYQRARFNASRDPEGHYITLSQQDISLWDDAGISAAETTLHNAQKLFRPDRYQFEAAIQSAHIHGRRSSEDVQGAVLSLYDKLLALSPSIGAYVGKAAALLTQGKAADAIKVLDGIQSIAQTYQPYWATRGAALKRLKQFSAAQQAYQRAIELTKDQAVREYLSSQQKVTT